MLNRLDKKAFITTLQGRTELGRICAAEQCLDFELLCRLAKTIEQRDTPADTGEKNAQVMLCFHIDIE